MNAGDQFLNWLQGQARNRDDKKLGGAARKALADMRRAARNSLYGPYDIVRVAPHIGPYLSGKPDADEWLSVIGALYAASFDNIPQSREVTFGKALRRLRDSEKGNDSLEARFMALLNSRADSLPGHLRQLIGLLNAAQKNIGLDWHELYEDVQSWDRAERYIQKKWLRHYYHPERADAGPTTIDTTIPATEGDDDED